MCCNKMSAIIYTVIIFQEYFYVIVVIIISFIAMYNNVHVTRKLFQILIKRGGERCAFFSPLSFLATFQSQALIKHRRITSTGTCARSYLHYKFLLLAEIRTIPDASVGRVCIVARKFKLNIVATGNFTRTARKREREKLYVLIYVSIN